MAKNPFLLLTPLKYPYFNDLMIGRRLYTHDCGLDDSEMRRYAAILFSIGFKISFFFMLTRKVLKIGEKWFSF